MITMMFKIELLIWLNTLMTKHFLGKGNFFGAYRLDAFYLNGLNQREIYTAY